MGAPAGSCRTYPNTARIVETQQQSSASVTVCAEAGLQVSKTVSASFDRTYDWVIDKAADGTTFETDGDGPATVGYTVTATPQVPTDGVYDDSGYEMGGTITVTSGAVDLNLNQDTSGLAIADSVRERLQNLDGAITDVPAGVWVSAGRTLTSLDEDTTTLDIDAAVAAAVTTALTTALTEGYRGTGATGSVRDILYELIAHMGESAIAGTTKTLKKLDGSTTAKTYTLDDASTPTSITETT